MILMVVKVCFDVISSVFSLVFVMNRIIIMFSFSFVIVIDVWCILCVRLWFMYRMVFDFGEMVII